jgi:hypothetical protein
LLKKISLLVILLGLLSISSFAAVDSAIADPSSIGVGARPLALGRAYAGLSDDANGIFINPAGLAGIKNIKLTSMSGQVLEDIDYVVIGGANPTDYGVFGFGYVSAGIPGIPITTVTGSGTTEIVVPAGATNYYASVATLSYSNYLSGIGLFRDQKNISYGVNLKYFMQGFSGGGSATRGANGAGWDMDLGLQYKANKSLTLGLSALNCLPETAGGRFTWDKDNVVEDIPAVIKTGFTAKLFGDDSYYGGKQDVLWGLDLDFPSEQNRQTEYHTGIEWWPISVMAVRAGLDQQQRAAEDVNGVDNNFTAGIGLKFNGFTFDYCYHQYSALTGNTTHFFSIGYVGEDAAPRAWSPKPALVVVVPSVNLKSFPDVPDGFWAKSPIEFMAALGVMDGDADGNFRPDDPVTRAELSQMLVYLKDMEVSDVTADLYPDVKKDHWAAKYIKAASASDFMKTYPDGTFRPGKKITRVEGAAIISRFTEAKAPAVIENVPFSDIPRDHWAAKTIMAARNYGLLDYLIGKDFEPGKKLTRAEVAEILSKTSYGKDKIKNLLKKST